MLFFDYFLIENIQLLNFLYQDSFQNLKKNITSNFDWVAKSCIQSFFIYHTVSADSRFLTFMGFRLGTFWVMSPTLWHWAMDLKGILQNFTLKVMSLAKLMSKWCLKMSNTVRPRKWRIFSPAKTLSFVKTAIFEALVWFPQFGRYLLYLANF